MSLKEYFDFEPVSIWIFGISIFIVGILVGYKIHLGWGSIILSIAIAIFAYGISKKSERMTETITEISKDAKETTDKIAKSTLYETIGVFEDRRLGLRERWGIFEQKSILIQGYRRGNNEFQIDFTEYRYYCSFSIWKCRTYIERAMIFQENFKMKEEEKLIHHIDCLFQDLCQGNVFFNLNFHINFQLDNEYKRHLQYIYNKLLTFNYFNRRDNSEYLQRYRILNNLRFLKGYSTTPIFWNR